MQLIKLKRPETITAISVEDLPDDEEVTAISYLSFSAQTSYIVTGSTSGALQVFDLRTMKPCFIEGSDGQGPSAVPSEIQYIGFRRVQAQESEVRDISDVRGQLVCVNSD